MARNSGSSNDSGRRRRRVSSLQDENRRNSMRRGASGESSVPIMANFEEWMKLVKDNKINQANTWNFALIDYFHDMAVLKEGDGINFQKASFTLDGCVKIYTSRVDSVASETGKLLSGLADGGKELEKDAQNEEGGDDQEEGEDGEVIQTQKQKRRKQRTDATLTTFDQLRVKNLDLELSVDPLFRKMCADFNEGGAKGLLLNSLAIDKKGRIVFDGQVDQQQDEAAKNEDENREVDPIDISAIREEFFYDVPNLDDLTICPSLALLNNALNDPSWNNTTIDFVPDTETDANFGENGAFDGDINDFQDEDGGFEPMLEANDDDEGQVEFGVPDIATGYEDDANGNDGVVVTSLDGVEGVPSVVMMSAAYFDETLSKNWAGPEHWKVQRIKSTLNTVGSGQVDKEGKPVEKKRTERQLKEPFLIDFLSPEGAVDEKKLFVDGKTSIDLPKIQQKSNTRNLLPNDEHFSSKCLTQLALKPKVQIFRKSGRRGGEARKEVDEEDIQDGKVFAQHANGVGSDDEDAPITGDYDANFFHNDDDDDGGDDDYQGADLPSSSQMFTQGGNSLLGNKKARPEYVNYTKAAKKVNIKLLKDNLWETMKIATERKPESDAVKEIEKTDEEIKSEQEEARTFTSFVQDLRKYYPAKQMNDISTSFCFICLLHLANEKGLVIEDEPSNRELIVRKDWTVSSTDLSA